MLLSGSGTIIRAPGARRILGAAHAVAARWGEWVQKGAPGVATAPRPTVLVYRNELLPFSETFIKEQMMAYARWRGVLIGRRKLNLLPLDGLDVRLLRPIPASDLLSRAWWRLCRPSDSVPAPIIRLIRREVPALLHVHFGIDAVDAWPLARALDIPMIVTLHGYDITIDRAWWEAGHWGDRFRAYPERLLELAAKPRVHFIAVSHSIRRRAIEFGIPASRVSVCHIGIDTRRFAPGGRPITEREPRVLFVGRLVEKKGCDVLIRALAKVQATVPEVRLVIVGEGGLRQGLRQFARHLGVLAEFRGSLPSDEVRRELEQARVLCLPSVTAGNGDAEGFGMVLLEAQASGVPVVTSARGGSEEGLQEGVTGFRFPERDIDALASRLVKLLTDDSLALFMSRSGPAFVSQHFDIRRCTSALELLYDVVSRCETEPQLRPIDMREPTWQQ